jgi:hypothetical protein
MKEESGSLKFTQSGSSWHRRGDPPWMITFPCSYLRGEVELPEERERHIAEHHPDLLPDHKDRIGHTLADPDQVRRSRRFGNARLFAKWYDDLLEGKHLVVGRCQ